jgi:hypothetical protein
MGFTDTTSKNDGGGFMDPMTLLALLQTGGSIANKFLPDKQAEAAEKEGKAERKLTRQQMLTELILRAAKIADQNAYDKQRAERMAPLARRNTEMRMSPPKLTELRNAATGRMNAAQPGGGDPGVASLVTSNFQQYNQQRQEAKSRAASITPEGLYTPQTDPLKAVQTQAPETYLDMSGAQKYENKSGDGLDDVEVQMLNKRLAEGATPQELSKMLATFRSKSVQQGVVV